MPVLPPPPPQTHEPELRPSSQVLKNHFDVNNLTNHFNKNVSTLLYVEF